MSFDVCTDECIQKGDKIIPINIIDIIFARTKKEKLGFLCHYVCLKSLNLGNIKRNGRWGFLPIWGINEFFSTIFSFGSLISNLFSYHFILKPVLKNDHISKVFKLQHYLYNIAFISSFCFHIHENKLTRPLDYFFAFIVLLYGLYVSFIRILHLVSPNFELLFRNEVKLSFIFYYAYHIYRMSSIEFDYVYNKLSCIFIVTTTFLLHIILFFCYKDKRHSKNILFFTLIFFIAGAIEVQDIPPYGYLIDSHALWHLISSLSTPFYYKFWAEDIENQNVITNALK